MDYRERLENIAGSENVYINEPMSEHTTFKIGGPADYYVTPADADALGQLIKFCNNNAISYHIHGNGSNVLFEDEGYKGLVIVIGANMSDINLKGNCIYAGAGAALARLSKTARDAELTGLEFASGIPGTVGGGLVMNAGAYGGEMKDVIVSAIVYDCENDRLLTLAKDEMELGYRTSIFTKKPYIVLEACFELKKADIKSITDTMQDFNQRRRDKQPLNYASAGSTFKRPEGYFAGALIEECGLKGFRSGDAMVSTQHAGFVVNAGNASAADVKAVISHVQEVVLRKTGVELETEVKIISSGE